MRLDIVGIIIALGAIGLVWYLNKEQETELQNIMTMIILLALVIGIVVDI